MVAFPEKNIIFRNAVRRGAEEKIMPGGRADSVPLSACRVVKPPGAPTRMKGNSGPVMILCEMAKWHAARR